MEIRTEFLSFEEFTPYEVHCRKVNLMENIPQNAEMERLSKLSKSGKLPESPQKLESDRIARSCHSPEPEIMPESENASEAKTLTTELFLRLLGHELKAPLNAVDGYVDMLRSAALGDQLAAYQPMLERCTVRLAGMRELITQIIALSRLSVDATSADSTGFVEYAKCAEWISLPTLIETVVADQQETAAAGHIRLEIMPPDAEVARTCTVFAPHWAMETILRNLVNNAIKYNRPGGNVQIELRKTDVQLEIEIRDTGLGMRATDVARLFGAFVRIQTPQTERIAGCGLGLWMVKRLVTLCHGEITVQSEPDVGSVFTLRWSSSPESES